MLVHGPSPTLPTTHRPGVGLIVLLRSHVGGRQVVHPATADNHRHMLHDSMTQLEAALRRTAADLSVGIEKASEASPAVAAGVSTGNPLEGGREGDGRLPATSRQINRVSGQPIVTTGSPQLASNCLEPGQAVEHTIIMPSNVLTLLVDALRPSTVPFTDLKRCSARPLLFSRVSSSYSRSQPHTPGPL